MTNIEDQIFKNILACWSSGITIITVASSSSSWQGFTANSFASVSVEPPLVCMNVANRLQARIDIAREGHFTINILSENQLEYGKRFAGFYDDVVKERFDGIECELTSFGDPILPNSMSWMSCEVEHMLNLGQNTMFIGRVVEGNWSEDKAPLMYHNRQWGTFQSTENR